VPATESGITAILENWLPGTARAGVSIDIVVLAARFKLACSRNINPAVLRYVRFLKNVAVVNLPK
jgi:hypothetical protein